MSDPVIGGPAGKIDLTSEVLCGNDESLGEAAGTLEADAVRDIEIRRALLHDLESRYIGDAETLIIDELPLCDGDARVDVAVINGMLAGYEIKSDRDDLRRLASQKEAYGRLFHQITLVTDSRQFQKVVESVPEWWGVMQATEEQGIVALRIARQPSANPSVDRNALVHLLWKDEAFDELRVRGMSTGMKNKPRHVLWRVLAETLNEAELVQVVSRRIKARGNWRSGRLRKLGGERYRPYAKL